MATMKKGMENKGSAAFKKGAGMKTTTGPSPKTKPMPKSGGKGGGCNCG